MTDVTKEEQKPVVETTAEKDVGAEKKDVAAGEGRRRRKTPVKEGVEAQEDDNTFKVFVGNLAFATTEDDLREYFNQHGKVINSNIIVRGTRSLGYGFVSYETDEEAKKAVQALDKSDLGGRQINVEQAKVKEAGEARPPRGEGRPPRGGFGRRGRGRGYIRARGGRSDDKEGKETARLDDEQPTDAANGEQTGDRARRERRPRGGRRFPRPARATSGEPTSGETSKTTLFVANLPFKVTNEDLTSIFKEYKVTSAHVVKLRNGRSKGFGFVEVENEEQQQKVLNELKNVVVDGRELVIKVALASQVPPATPEGEEKVEEVKTESA